jgi:hypothetical protein
VKNLAGQTFGFLKVLHTIGVNERQQRVWLCECVCGKTKPIITACLTSGHTVSCGCKRLQLAHDAKAEHLPINPIEQQFSDADILNMFHFQIMEGEALN